MRHLGILLLIALISACSAEKERRGTGTGTGNDGGTTNQPDGGGIPIPDGAVVNNDGAQQGLEGCDKMDILFVIDNSGSMGSEQASLAANFPAFMNILENYRNASGDMLDYHVGLLHTGTEKDSGLLGTETTHYSADGALIQNEGCGMTRRWIERSDANPTEIFSCSAKAIGVRGNKHEMPLRAIVKATTDRVSDGTNAGFFREDALLAVVILTDEDDCSRPEDKFESKPFDFSRDKVCDASKYISLSDSLTAIDNVKGDHGRWAVALIAGLEANGCTSNGENGSMQEAKRLKEFLGLVGDNTVMSSICEADLASPLMDAMNTFEAACESFPIIE